MITPDTINRDIRNAVADERLLERAMFDFVQEFVGFVIRDKTAAQAIVELDSWRSWFATIRRNHDRASS